MAGPADILRELHRLRRHAKDLQDQIERLPRMLKTQQAKVARQEEVSKQAQESLKKLKVTVKGKEDTLKANFEQINKYKKQRDTAAGTKEYDALGTEMAQAQARCKQLEDEIFTGLTEIDERAAQIPALDKTLKEAQADVTNFDKNSKARQTELESQLKTVLAGIKEVENAVPADIRPQYERLVGQRGEDALSLVQDRNCVACYTSITAQSYNELYQGMFVTCKNCGRILYLPQQTAVAP